MQLKRTITVALGAALIGAAVAATSYVIIKNNPIEHEAAQQQNQSGTLETIVGPLEETVPLLQLETIRHADQITNERRTNKEIRGNWFYTADFAMYTVKDNEAYLHLARGHNNLIFKNLDEATRQLRETDNYVIHDKKDIEAVVNAKDTLTVKLSDLRLQMNGPFGYFEINTDNPGSLNKAERAFAERAYGQGNDFVLNMMMLNKNGIRQTRVYVLTPDYVQRNTPQNGALARASRLYDFDVGSRFIASAGVLAASLACVGYVNKASNVNNH